MVTMVISELKCVSRLKIFPVSQKILSLLVILSMEKTMVTMVISELKCVSRLKIFPETGPLTLTFQGHSRSNMMGH